jgi:hypothetical protein
MKTTIKFVKENDSSQRVAPLFSTVHNVPVTGWTLQLHTPHRGLNCLDEYEGWYLFEEDGSGYPTGEAEHFARYDDAVQYARDLYDNGDHLERNYV